MIKKIKDFFCKYIKNFTFDIFTIFFIFFRLIMNNIYYRLKIIKDFANFYIIYISIILLKLNFIILIKKKFEKLLY